MLNQRRIIETIFALPRVVCGLLCSTVLVLSFYANEVSDVMEPSNVASAKVVESITNNKL